MVRRDLHPSRIPVPSEPSLSCQTSAAETMPQPYAAPAATADPHRPATMTEPIYDQPPSANDGAFYPVYPEFYDYSNMDHSAAAAAAAGQHSPGFSATGGINGSYPPGWDFGLVDFGMPYPPLPPVTDRGEGDGLQPQAPWNYGAQAQPALLGSTMASTLAMADPMSQQVPVKESTNTNGSYNSLWWPQPPPMGRISPSPSQSSYYTASPASGPGTHDSRHNSCSSMPAPGPAALEQTRFDAWFQPISDHAVSPGDGTLTPAGFHPGAEPSSPYAGPKAGHCNKNQRHQMSTTTTTDHNAGTVSPALTPSPKHRTPTGFGLPPFRSARLPPNHQQKTPETSRKDKAIAPAHQRTSQEKQAAAGSRGQQQQQKQPPPPPPARARNRDAANKCRAKTKQAVSDLESTERAMSSEHRELSATARGLRDEVLLLKTALLSHGGCDDALIQQYLTNQARKVGSGAAHPQHQQQQQQQQQRPQQQQQQQQHRHQGHGRA